MLSLTLSFVFLISIASAVEIKFSKDIYSPGETLQAEIYGSFPDGLDLENIHFYRERNIPVEYDLLKLKDKYLLYALLPSKEGDYSLKIKDTSYETDTGISYSDIVKEFRIQTSNLTNKTPLSINPGFILTREDFYIRLKANNNVDVEAEFLGEKQSVSLIGREEEKIYFSVGEITNYTETTIKIGEYIIPVIIFPKTTQIIIQTPKFRFNPLELEVTILKKESYSFKVALVNYGDKDLTNIGLSSNVLGLDVEMNPESIPELGEGEKEFIDVTFSSKKEGNFSGKIIASVDGLSAELEINIDVTENESEIIENPEDNAGYIEEKGCEDSGGNFCKAGEKCSVSLELTIDGYCCKGECITGSGSDTSWVWGLVIILVVVGGMVFFSIYMKKRQKKPIDILKQRQDKYQERMAPQKEVRGNLSKT